MLFWARDDKDIHELAMKLREVGIDLEQEDDAVGWTHSAKTVGCTPIPSPGHLRYCKVAGEKEKKKEQQATATLFQRREFWIYGDVLKRVKKFKYLGRWLL